MSESPFPSRGQRLAYALGFPLPSRARWVVHDLTTPGWRWRHLRRVLLQVVPPSLLLALLPGPAYLHVLLPAFVILSAVFVGAAYADDFRDRRLRQHGVTPPPPDRPWGKDDLLTRAGDPPQPSPQPGDRPRER